MEKEKLFITIRFSIKNRKRRDRKRAFWKQPDIKERLTNTETAISHKEFLIRVFPSPFIHPSTLTQSYGNEVVFFCLLLVGF